MYAVLNMGYTPSQFANLSINEKSFVMACVQIKLEEEKKQNAKLKANSRKR